MTCHNLIHKPLELASYYMINDALLHWAWLLLGWEELNKDKILYYPEILESTIVVGEVAFFSLSRWVGWLSNYCATTADLI